MMRDDKLIDAMQEAFRTYFTDDTNTQLLFAPGRVNLIGEHTDYNGGHVLPGAISRGTYVLFRKREDRQIRCYSLNQEKDGLLSKSIDDILAYDRKDAWANYVYAAVYAFVQKGYDVSAGFDAVFGGNIPVGSGLSSSASLLVLMGSLLRKINHLEVSNQDLALLAQYAEQKYIGLNCGIMDQFAIAMGKKDHAIYLDTSTLDYEYVPFIQKDVVLMIMNTNKPRGLQDSKYNERVAECAAALENLRKARQIASLGELTPEEFDELQGVIHDPVCRLRAKHAVYENARVLLSVKALRDNDFAEFGRLMNASHCSLRDDYEVSGKELDTLAETAWKVPGVIGARMTGAGFGGCGIALLEKGTEETFTEIVGKAYEETIGYPASFFAAEISDGPVELPVAPGV